MCMMVNSGIGFLLSGKMFLLGMAHTVCWPVKTEEIVT
jgi:hypothetical protein